MARSPIEVLLHRSIIEVSLDLDMCVRNAKPDEDLEVVTCEGGVSFARRGGWSEPFEFDDLGPEPTTQRRSTWIASNVLACGYRVDLALYVSSKRELHAHAPHRYGLLLVECDGFDWHERTVQQASYDRARDREILRKTGCPVVRFTGSEISKDARACAREVIELASSISDAAADVASETARIAISSYRHFDLGVE